MAVSKRLRYEILRRDNHQCRYCGAAAPDANLTVDHVMPRALGGSDDPSNLVAACGDCNAGKSASSPDSSHLDDAKEGALRWAAALKRAIATREDETDADRQVQEWFRKKWEVWFTYPLDCPLVDDEVPEELRTYHRLEDSWGWKRSLRQWQQMGAVSPKFTVDAIDIAMKKRGLDRESRWRYFCGVMWNEIKARQELAAQYMVEDDPSDKRPAGTSPDHPMKPYLEEPFPYIYMAEAFVVEVLEMAGAPAEVIPVATRGLWCAMEDAFKAFATEPHDDWDSAEEHCREVFTGSAAWHMNEIRTICQAGG